MRWRDKIEVVCGKVSAITCERKSKVAMQGGQNALVINKNVGKSTKCTLDDTL